MSFFSDAKIDPDPSTVMNVKERPGINAILVTTEFRAAFSDLVTDTTIAYIGINLVFMGGKPKSSVVTC